MFRWLTLGLCQPGLKIFRSYGSSISECYQFDIKFFLPPAFVLNWYLAPAYLPTINEIFTIIGFRETFLRNVIDFVLQISQLIWCSIYFYTGSPLIAKCSNKFRTEFGPTSSTQITQWQWNFIIFETVSTVTMYVIIKYQTKSLTQSYWSISTWF